MMNILHAEEIKNENNNMEYNSKNMTPICPILLGLADKNSNATIAQRSSINDQSSTPSEQLETNQYLPSNDFSKDFNQKIRTSRSLKRKNRKVKLVLIPLNNNCVKSLPQLEKNAKKKDKKTNNKKKKDKQGFYVSDIDENSVLKILLDNQQKNQ